MPGWFFASPVSSPSPLRTLEMDNAGLGRTTGLIFFGEGTRVQSIYHCLVISMLSNSGIYVKPGDS